MDRCGAKKLKMLLAEVPNLVLTGDGGFMRVSTVEHSKLLCDPFPPKAFDATGVTFCPSSLTPTSTDAKYQPQTYINPQFQEELANIKTKATFFKRLNMRNATIFNRRLITEVPPFTGN